MPQSCSVRGCKSVFRKNNGISFHCFPKEEKIRQLWLSALSYGVLVWDRRPRVCSKHFKKEDFVFGGILVKLRKNAIPQAGSVNNALPSSSLMENIPPTSYGTMKNGDIVAETGPAIPINNIHTTTPSEIPFRVEVDMDTKHQTKDSTPKAFEQVSMFWSNDAEDVDCPLEEEHTMLTTNIVRNPAKVTKKRIVNPISEATRHSTEPSVNMSWTSETSNHDEDGLIRQSNTTSTQQGEMDSSDIRSCRENCSSLKTIMILEKEVAYLKQENQRLQSLSMPKPLFCLQQFSENDKKILFYTGFQTYEILSVVFKWILPSGDLKDIFIYNDSPKKKTHGRVCKLSAENQFFLTLIRLRRGMTIETLSDWFSISKSCADGVFLSWINLLYLRLGSLDIWPSRNELIKRASVSMRRNYPNVIGSIDCTEFFIQRPSSLVKQSQCYSNYKGATTLKSLIMIDPAGAIIYTSPLFTGSISDKSIIEDSGFIDILKEKVDEGKILPGDTILADKGFNVKDLFQDIHLEINIPVFRVGGTQFTTEEVSVIRKVAHERIHVERAIGRLKNYKILSSKIAISSLGAMQQIYTVCVLLSNFRYGLISINK